MVDFYIAMYQTMLEYFCYHPVIIYNDLYNKLKNMFFSDDNNMEIIARRIVLSSIYTRRNQAITQIYQVSIANIWEYDKSSFFMTVIVNFHWSKVQIKLKEEQSATK